MEGSGEPFIFHCSIHYRYSCGNGYGFYKHKTMTKETLERLLNRACEIIVELEAYVRPSEFDEEWDKEINVFFDEVLNTDWIEDEVKRMEEGQ
jgi:hypothetical protein